MADRWLVIHPDGTIRKADNEHDAVRFLHPSGCSRIVKFSDIPTEGAESPGPGSSRHLARGHLQAVDCGGR